MEAPNRKRGLVELTRTQCSQRQPNIIDKLLPNCTGEESIEADEGAVEANPAEPLIGPEQLAPPALRYMLPTAWGLVP